MPLKYAKYKTSMQYMQTHIQTPTDDIIPPAGCAARATVEGQQFMDRLNAWQDNSYSYSVLILIRSPFQLHASKAANPA